MGAFGGEPKTVNGAFSPATDNKTPAFGSLPAGSMTSLTGLAGTTGTDAKLIHGDRWQQIDGNLTENIKDDLKTHVLADEIWTVDGDYTMKVVGDTKDTRQGETKEYYIAESRFEYTTEHTDLHHDQDHTINLTHTYDILHTEIEVKSVDIALKGMVFEGKGTVVDATIAKAEAWAVGAEAWGVGVAAGHFKNELVTLDVQEKASKLEMHGVRGRLDALESQAGAARTVIMPVRIGICIAVHIDSPWA